VEREAQGLRERRNYAATLQAVASLKPAVDRFFDDVLVMAEDPALRENRLALMRRVGALFADVADFRKIQADVP
jgi:glycyl-tRNA synthetase beta chain